MPGNHLYDNLVDFAKVFVSSTYRVELYDEAYARRAHRHASVDFSRAELELVLNWRRHNPPKSLLDLGCNTGRPLHFLCQGWRAEGTGLDINRAAVEMARQNFPQHSFELYVGKLLPFENGKFDHVALHHVIGHLADPAATLSEIYRVLCPGGTLSVITPNSRYKIWQFPFNLVRGYLPDPTIVRYYNKSSLKQILTQAGFKIERLITQGSPPVACPSPLHDVFRLRVIALARRNPI
jgi:ubiquinone/menaquinone biosynthesis C-methylase UbiE